MRRCLACPGNLARWQLPGPCGHTPRQKLSGRFRQPPTFGLMERMTAPSLKQPLGYAGQDLTLVVDQPNPALELKTRSLAFVDAIGQHPTNGWAGEPSFLVFGLTLEAARPFTASPTAGSPGEPAAPQTSSVVHITRGECPRCREVQAAPASK